MLSHMEMTDIPYTPHSLATLNYSESTRSCTERYLKLRTGKTDIDNCIVIA